MCVSQTIHPALYPRRAHPHRCSCGHSGWQTQRHTPRMQSGCRATPGPPHTLLPHHVRTTAAANHSATGHHGVVGVRASQRERNRHTGASGAADGAGRVRVAGACIAGGASYASAIVADRVDGTRWAQTHVLVCQRQRTYTPMHRHNAPAHASPVPVLMVPAAHAGRTHKGQRLAWVSRLGPKRTNAAKGRGAAQSGDGASCCTRRARTAACIGTERVGRAHCGHTCQSPRPLAAPQAHQTGGGNVHWQSGMSLAR
jgi:hypothetical protein